MKSNGGFKEGGWDGKESMDLNKEKGVGFNLEGNVRDLLYLNVLHGKWHMYWIPIDVLLSERVYGNGPILVR